jgi:hypothetical protein
VCPDAGVDRDVEAYKAVRAHELTLNEARAELERGVLAPLIALNGGAIVAFLTLIGAVSKNVTLNVNSEWRVAAAVSAGLAIVVWAAGLVCAARAVVWASRQQGEINKGYRLMRELVEAHIIVPVDSSAKLCTTQRPLAFRQRRLGIVSDAGPRHTELSGMPRSTAAASVKTLNALPAWRRDWLARLKRRRRWLGSRAVIARTAPVRGSIATNAAAGSERRRSQPAAARSATRCRRGSSVVWTRSPPCRARLESLRRTSSRRARSKNVAKRTRS